MNKVISIYPKLEHDYLVKCEEYIKLAKKHGFNEVFTSLHLPEVKLNIQVNFLNDLASIVKKYEMALIADIGGNSIKQIIEDDKLMNIVKAVDYFRLDYGYDHHDIKYLHDSLLNKGFIINASIYNGEDSKKEVEYIRSLKADVKACHNYYPREESGIDEELALIQKKIFNELNVPIYYCVPCQNNPRGPIYKGLPTIESHRYLDMKQVLSELVNKYDADGIMLSDNFYSEDDLKNCEYIEEVDYEIPEVTIPIYQNIQINKQIQVHTFNDSYDSIIFQTHVFRYDSNARFLRSKSSRTMAEFAKSIEPENCVGRKAGYITIDNKEYERYSGELQVVLIDSPPDKRINVVGYIDSKDIAKLLEYRNNCSYTFVK